MMSIVRAIFAIFDIIFILAFAILVDLTAFTPFRGDIFIPQGSATKIIANLPNKNFNKTPLDPKILAALGVVKHGYLDLGDVRLTKIDFFHKLTTAKPAMFHITLIPGETTIIFLKDLAKTHDLNFTTLEREYNATAPFYEGFLIPETYHMAKGLDEKGIVKNLAQSSLKAHKELYSKNFKGEFNATIWLEVLSKASVIQKEAANISEMELVSSVIDNRLKKGMKLQMDGTLNYGLYSHAKVTPERIRNDKSEFNTYIHEGLPKSPVCVVSKEAIEAALKPEVSEYLYFMRDKRTGKHTFSKTLNEHNRAINIQIKLKN